MTKANKKFYVYIFIQGDSKHNESSHIDLVNSNQASVFWNDIIDLPSDWIYKAGTEIN